MLEFFEILTACAIFAFWNARRSQIDWSIRECKKIRREQVHEIYEIKLRLPEDSNHKESNADGQLDERGKIRFVHVIGPKSAFSATIPRESGPIKFLEKAQLLFGHKTRELVCTPVIEELREDYILAKKNCHSPMEKRWAKFCFGFRAFVAFIGCFRAACGTSLGKLVPAMVKQWWTLFR
jgi:hypothetical protein